MFISDVSRKIHECMKSNGWGYGYNDEQNVFCLGFNMSCKIPKCNVTVQVFEDKVHVIGNYNLKVDENSKFSVMEYLMFLNSRLWFGKFVVDHVSGMILFKYTMDCSDGIVPSEIRLGSLIQSPVWAMEPHGDEFLSILFGMESIDEVIEKTVEKDQLMCVQAGSSCAS